VGDKSADSSANAAGNVTGVPLNAHLGWHSPDDLVPKHSGCSFSTLLARQVANDIVSGKKPRISGALRRALARRDPKFGIFGHFGALAAPRSPVAIFESPEFWQDD
jgi:hypothetical protein